jgi:hypothetical protein
MSTCCMHLCTNVISTLSSCHWAVSIVHPFMVGSFSSLKSPPKSGCGWTLRPVESGPVLRSCSSDRVDENKQHSQHFVPNEFVFRFLLVNLVHDQLSDKLDVFQIPGS